jgi:transketolase C-terminal domain/subunit
MCGSCRLQAKEASGAVVNKPRSKPLDVDAIVGGAAKPAHCDPENQHIYGGLGGAVAEVWWNMRPCHDTIVIWIATAVRPQPDLWQVKKVGGRYCGRSREVLQRKK